MKNIPNKNPINQPPLFSIKKFFASRLEPRSYNLEADSGYTFIEMLIVFGIVALLSGMIMTNYVQHRKEETLINETYKISQLIRRAQNLALSPQGANINGFGVYLETTSSGGTVKLFSDKNSDYFMEEGEDQESLVLSPLVRLSVNPSPQSVLYVPPDPTLYINSFSNRNTTITVSLVEDENKKMTIDVNFTGLVEVK